MGRIAQRIATMQKQNKTGLSGINKKVRDAERRKTLLERKKKAVEIAKTALAGALTGKRRTVNAMHVGVEIDTAIRRKNILLRKINIEISRKEKKGQRTPYQLAQAEILGVEIAALKKEYRAWEKKLSSYKIDLSHYTDLERRGRKQLKKANAL